MTELEHPIHFLRTELMDLLSHWQQRNFTSVESMKIYIDLSAENIIEYFNLEGENDV